MTGAMSAQPASRSLRRVTAYAFLVAAVACAERPTEVNPVVTVTAVSPTSGPRAGGTQITITGTNLAGVTSVIVGGNALISRTVVSPTHITGIAPAGEPGPADVVVVAAGRESRTCSGCFNYELDSALSSPVTAGLYHACALATSGAAYCWGRNYSGQLGIGSTAHSSIPLAVMGGQRFHSVSAGWYFTCALTDAGEAYCWGFNIWGQLGDGTTSNSPVPVAVTGGLRFTMLVAGAGHVCGLTRDGLAFCWGGGGSGRLGNDAAAESSTPVPVAGGHRFVALAAGGAHSCALTALGSAWCWGRNTWGQLGDGSTSDRTVPVAVAGGVRFTALATGSEHTCGLTGSGTAYCWGLGNAGQLGHTGYTGDDAHPVPQAVDGGLRFTSLATGSFHTCATEASGAAWCWGRNEMGQLGDDRLGIGIVWPVAVAGGFTFRSLAGGGDHTCGLATDSVVRCWGDNGYGQLGDGTTQAWWAPGPVAGGTSLEGFAAGAYHTCGIGGSGAAHCWGDGSSFQLGNGTATNSAFPVAVSGGLSLEGLASGGYHACARSSSGASYCWGWNGDGEGGTGDNGFGYPDEYLLVPAAVAGDLNLTAISAGAWHTCGLTASAAAYCWGWNGDGALGDGSYGDRWTPAAVTGGLQFSALSAGWDHSCGLTVAGEIYCWGAAYGPEPAMIPGGLTYAAVTTGAYHACGITIPGAAYCWGRNDYGQLGDGSLVSTSTPRLVSGGLSFRTLAAGAWHTCGATSNGTAYCWGDNLSGQLGSGSITPSSTPVAVAGGFTFGALVAGAWHTCGVSNQGVAGCWGWNFHGQLGRGMFGYATTPTAIAPFGSSPPVTALTDLARGSAQTLALEERCAPSSRPLRRDRRYGRMTGGLPPSAASSARMRCTSSASEGSGSERNAR